MATRGRFLMPRRASGPSQQSTDLSAAPSHFDPTWEEPGGAELGRQRGVPGWAAKAESPATLRRRWPKPAR
jgi:hypothetical protein